MLTNHLNRILCHIPRFREWREELKKKNQVIVVIKNRIDKCNAEWLSEGTSTTDARLFS